MSEPQFFDRELSWLSFNERVLQEAADLNVPIIERIRFLGIYSANLDEFFKVKVAHIRSKALIELAQENKETYWKQRLDDVLLKVAELSEKFQLVCQKAFHELNKHNIHLLLDDSDFSVFNSQLTNDQKAWLDNYFHHRILGHITPIIINSMTSLASCLEDEGCYFLVALHHQESVQFALVEIPRKKLPRFIVLPTKGSQKKKYIVMLDDVIHYHIDTIFKGSFNYSKIEAYSIELTRDAEYDLTDEIDKSLLDKMSKGLKQRVTAEPVRLVYDRTMPSFMRYFLRKRLDIEVLDNLVPDARYRMFRDFLDFPNLGRKHLEKAKLTALESMSFKGYSSVFQAITEQDILLYYPYHKFSHFTEFVRQASYDPYVEHIKINIYRVAKNSQIIHSLIDAVKNGKKVTVVVELRARFDEEANIQWATRMKDAGIHVEFGIDTLKIHSKLCVVLRNENGKLTRYAHIGTGNFHENNARVYTDFALFTCHKEIALEVDNVFSFISHSYKRFRFNHLLVSPLTSRRRMFQLIDNEIGHAEAGRKAEITLKLNNLVDSGLITKLYQASNAGVKIKMIIRGMCTLIPNVKGQSENIKIISIIDRFLEHPRVMLFRDDGNNSLFIGSADWMERNIDHRVEVSCPIYDETIKKRIIHILNLHFKDTMKARIINQAQDNPYVPRGNKKKSRSQIAIYNYLAQEEQINIVAKES